MATLFLPGVPNAGSRTATRPLLSSPSARALPRGSTTTLPAGVTPSAATRIATAARVRSALILAGDTFTYSDAALTTVTVTVPCDGWYAASPR